MQAKPLAVADVSDWIVGVMMASFTFVGLVMASRAADNGICVFGWSLAGFGVLFLLGTLRRCIDRAEGRLPHG